MSNIVANAIAVSAILAIAIQTQAVPPATTNPLDIQQRDGSYIVDRAGDNIALRG